MIGPTLAMHMANELLSVPVAAVTLALMAALVAVAARRARRATTDDRLPLMGVMGAFVFAAQMINFTLPGMPGTSGHLGGGVLLAILLGPSAAIVTMTAILIVQCLLFQDGGLLALGCNVINMAVVPCLIGSGLYRLLLGSPARAAAWRQYLAAWLACVAGVAAGAAMVPVEAALSGVLQVPLGHFLGVMIGVHLIIGLCEGAVTFAAVAYLRRVRPELMGLDPTDSSVSARAARPGGSDDVDPRDGPALGRRGQLVRLDLARRLGMELHPAPLRGGRESGPQRFARGGGRRSLARGVVAHARLHAARLAAGRVTRRTSGRRGLDLAQRGRLAVAGRRAGDDRHPGHPLRRVALPADPSARPRRPAPMTRPRRPIRAARRPAGLAPVER